MSEFTPTPITYGEKREIDQGQRIVAKLSLLANSVETARPEVGRIIEETESISVDTQEIQKRTIERLGEVDKKGTGVVLSKLRRLSNVAGRFVGENANIANFHTNDFLPYKEADDMLLQHLQSSAERQVASPLQELIRNLQIKNRVRIEDSAKNIMELCENPDVVWSELIREGVITQDYVDNIEHAATYIEMAGKWQVIEAASSNLPQDQLRALRAKVFTPYLTEGNALFKDFITAGLIDEIVDGRFDMEAEFVNSALEMFTQFEHDLKKPGLGFRQKAARMAAVAAVCSVMVASASRPREISPNLISPPAVTEFMDEIPVEQAPITNRSGTDTRKASSEKTTESDRLFDDERGSDSTIDNGSPEGMKEKQKQVDWAVQGSNLGGLYRRYVGTEFVGPTSDYPDRQFSWRINSETHGRFDDIYGRGGLGFNPKSDIILTKVYKRVPSQIILPVKYGYTVNPDSIVLKIDDKEVNVNRGLWRDWSGQYILQIVNRDKLPDGKVTFKYGIVKDSNYTLPFAKGVSKDEDALWYNFAPVDKLPKIVQDKFQEIKNSNGSQFEKAKALEDWIKHDFIYSLNRSYSDYYQRAKTPEEFISRIFKYKRTDCDVANTTLLALVRNFGIPSRMAFGYNNGDSFLLNKDVNELTQGEDHGWVEINIDGKWLTLDATPEKIDDDAAKELGGAGLSLPDLFKGGLPQNLEDLLLALESVKDFSRDAAGLGRFLTALYVASLLASLRGLRRIREKGLIAHQMAYEAIPAATEEEAKKIDRQTGIIKQFFDQYIDKESTISRADPSLAHRAARRIVWTALPLFRNRLMHGDIQKSMKGAKERAVQVTNEIAESKIATEEIDPVDLFIKIGGYDAEKMYSEIEGRNLYGMVAQLKNHIYKEGFNAFGENIGGSDPYLSGELRRAIIGTAFDRDDYGQHQVSKKLRAAELDKYIDDLAKKGITAYRKEAQRRRAAKIIDPKLRSPEQRSYAKRPELNLSDTDVEALIRNEVARPFAVIWHLVNG